MYQEYVQKTLSFSHKYVKKTKTRKQKQTDKQTNKQKGNKTIRISNFYSSNNIKERDFMVLENKHTTKQTDINNKGKLHAISSEHLLMIWVDFFFPMIGTGCLISKYVRSAPEPLVGLQECIYILMTD